MGNYDLSLKPGTQLLYIEETDFAQVSCLKIIVKETFGGNRTYINNFFLYEEFPENDSVIVVTDSRERNMPRKSGNNSERKENVKDINTCEESERFKMVQQKKKINPLLSSDNQFLISDSELSDRKVEMKKIKVNNDNIEKVEEEEKSYVSHNTKARRTNNTSDKKLTLKEFNASTHNAPPNHETSVVLADEESENQSLHNMKNVNDYGEIESQLRKVDYDMAANSNSNCNQIKSSEDKFSAFQPYQKNNLLISDPQIMSALSQRNVIISPTNFQSDSHDNKINFDHFLKDLQGNNILHKYMSSNTNTNINQNSNKLYSSGSPFASQPIQENENEIIQKEKINSIENKICTIENEVISLKVQVSKLAENVEKIVESHDLIKKSNLNFIMNECQKMIENKMTTRNPLHSTQNSGWRQQNNNNNNFNYYNSPYDSGTFQSRVQASGTRGYHNENENEIECENVDYYQQNKKKFEKNLNSKLEEKFNELEEKLEKRIYSSLLKPSIEKLENTLKGNLNEVKIHLKNAEKRSKRTIQEKTNHQNATSKKEEKLSELLDKLNEKLTMKEGQLNIFQKEQSKIKPGKGTAATINTFSDNLNDFSNY